MKPIAFAVALALTAAPLLSAPPALAAPAAKAATPASPAWVARSNALAQILLDAQGPFQPEETGFFGVPGYDDKVADLGPDNGKRYRAAMAKARDELKAKLATEKDPNVRQDLEIMIHAASQNIEGSELNEKYLLPWSDAPQTVFSGLNLLLSDQVPAERRAKAIDRLKAYAGLQPGGTAFTTLARQRYEERLKDSSLLQPTRIEVQQSLDNVETYITGIESLLKKYQIAGTDEAMKALAGQMKDYAAWTRKEVLPKARTDARLPAPLYAYQLKQVGIDIDPKLLMQRAQLEFMETRSAMQQLAPLVVKDKGLKVADTERPGGGDPRAEGRQDRRRPSGRPLPQGDRRDRSADPRACHRRRAPARHADAPGFGRRERGQSRAAFPAGAAGQQHRAAGHLRAAAGQPGGGPGRTVRRFQLRCGSMDAERA